MLTKTIDLQQTPLSLQELLALVKQDTLVVLKEGDQEVARLSPPLVEPTPDDVQARLKTFREATRDIGEETGQEAFEERYTKK